MAFLKRANGETAGQIIELKPDRIIIGRSPEHCHVVLDPNGVSRRHAEIYRKAEDYFLADLNSRNLTKVNNTKVIPGIDHRLSPGDRINICDVEFLFYPQLPADGPSKEPGDIMIVTEGENQDARPSPHARRLALKRHGEHGQARGQAQGDPRDQPQPLHRAQDRHGRAQDPRFAHGAFPQAERLFLVLVDPETKRLVRKAFKYRPAKKSIFSTVIPADEIPMSISRSIVNHVLGQKKAVLSQDAGADKNLPTSASIADLKIRSVMCVPLLTPDREALGIIQLDTSDRKQFAQEDLDVLAAVACQAAIAIQNAQMHESLLERERVEPRPEARRAGSEAILAAVGAGDPGIRVFRALRPGLRGRRRLLRLRSAAGKPAGHRAGRRLRQGRGGRAHDGEVFGRHALLHPHRKLPGRRRQRAQQLALLGGHRREVHHPLASPSSTPRNAPWRSLQRATCPS